MNLNYRTLNKDIGMIQRTNRGWDLWFDNGDIVEAEDFHSLQVGIIIACLTSWNYLNRYGNPTYEVFGNKAYELLKSNTSTMVAYKIQQYFIECLKRMRRVYEVVYVNVLSSPVEPNTYFVEFKVISINDQIVTGDFSISTDTSKSTSYIEYSLYTPHASNETPLTIDLWLKNEYGGGLGGEILYMYIKRGENDYEFMGIVGRTDETGYLRVEYSPTENNETNAIYFDFQGNSTYNPSTSERKTFKTEFYEYYVEFTNEDIATFNKYADISLKAYKQSLLDNSIYDLSNTTITVIGSDNKIYNATTDDNGEVTIRVDIRENTVFTAYYDDSSDTTNVTIIKQTPTIEFTTNKTDLLVGDDLVLRAIVEDEFGNRLQKFNVEFNDGEDIIGVARTNSEGVAILTTDILKKGDYSITANTLNTNFYNPSTSDPVIVSIDKHIMELELSVQDGVLVEDHLIGFFVSVTEDGSNLNGLNILFKDNDSNIIGNASCENGIASLFIDTLDVGEHIITAIFDENDYFYGSDDSIECTIVMHDYELSIDVEQTTTLVSKKYGNCAFKITPHLEDNGIVCNQLYFTDEQIAITYSEGNNHWVMDNYLYDIDGNCLVEWGKTITFTATFGEIIETTRIKVPIWEDDCVMDATNEYRTAYVNVNELSTQYVQNTSDDLCKKSWKKYDGLQSTVILNNAIQGDCLVYYTATQPVRLSYEVITGEAYEEVSYGGWKTAEDLWLNGNDEGDGQQSTGNQWMLNTGDVLWLVVDGTINYTIETIQYPETIFEYDSSDNTYYLEVQDVRESIIGKEIPTKEALDNAVISCKAKLTSNSENNQFMIGISEPTLQSSYFEMFRIKGNGEAEYVKNSVSQGTLYPSASWQQSSIAIFEDKWVTLELTIMGTTAIGKIYGDDDELLATTTTIDLGIYQNPHIFIAVNGNGSLGTYVKNIKVESLNNDDGSTVLFEDSGVTGTKNDDFLCTKTSGNYTLTTDSTGTTFVCTGGDGFYIPNIDLHDYSDLEITWTFTYGTRYACHISLLNSNKSYSNNMRWHNGGTSTPTATWHNPSGTITINHTLTSGDTMKLIKSNDTFTLYCNDESLGSCTPNYDVYYIGLTSADGNRPFGYKDLKIIDTSGGGSTVLFEDACSSASGLSNYGSSVAVRGSSSTMTMTYDSTENAYKCQGSNNYYAMIPIPVLNDEDGYVLSADVKGQSISANAIGLCLDNRNDTTSYSYAVWLESLNKVVGKQFSLNSDGAVNQHTGLSLSASNWYRMELTVDGTSLTGKLYDGDTVLVTDSTTLTVENRQVGIFLITQNGTTNSTCYVKNIKAESLGGGSTILFEDDCSSDRSNEYTNDSLQSSSYTNYLSMNYNSNGYYTIQATNNEGNHYAKWIDVLTGKDNIRFSVEVSTNVLNGTNRFGIVVGDNTAYKNERYHLSNQLEHQIFVGTSETLLDSHSITGLSANTWYRLEYEIQGTSYTFKVLDMEDNELYSTTGTFDSRVITSSTTKRYGLYYLNYYPTGAKMYRNIKAESLGDDSTIIYQPTLDGTESITTIATYTPTITDNTLTNGCGYLTNGWDNTIDWELTFDYYTTGDNNGYLVIPKGTTQRDYNGIQQWHCNQLNFYVNGTKPTGYITNATSCNEWISVKITKIGYVWTVYYNGVQKTQWDTESYASVVDNWTEMCIGLDKNSSSRYSTIKNIKVKSIGGDGSD